MIKIYKNYKTEEILSRKIDDYGEYEEVVKGIIADVAKCGDEAVKKYCLKFDGFMADSLEVTAAEFDEAESALADDYKAVIRASAANIAEFHKRQLKQGFEIKKQGGIVLGQKYTAVAARACTCRAARQATLPPCLWTPFPQKSRAWAK